MKKRIRVGNDFDISWSIKRGGVVEDFTTAVDKKLTMVVYGKTIDNPNFTITGGTLLINVPRELVTTLGDYRLVFEYTLPDAGQPDGDLKCQTDVIPFRIVATTAEADVIATIDVASDVAIGFRGDKGLQGDDAYQVWLDAGNVGTLADYLAWQRQPAIDAGNTVVDQTVLFLNEQATALEDRVNLFFDDVQTTTITPIEQAEEARANAEGDETKGRVKAENDRVAAEIMRNETFDQKMGEADGKIVEMNTTLSTYDGRVTQVESDIDQLAGEVSLLDAVQGAKIKDIESIISTMNPNQSAQLSVSGVSPLSLPKNAANGGMSVKMEGLTAENLVVNGDFRNGATGWIKLNTVAISLYAGDLLISGGTNLVDGAGFSISSPLNGHKYYLSSRLKPKYTTNIFQVELRTTTPFIVAATSNTYANNQWLNLSGIITGTTSGSTRLEVIMRFNSTGDIAGSEILVDNIQMINLTATFGAGNEPTKEQCDLMFSSYFEGKKSFEPTGRIRGVDKNGLNPTALYLTAPELRSNGLVKDEIRKGANGYELVKRISEVDGTVLANPAITPISYGGVLNSASNGTVYHEPIIADAGVYDTKMDILLTDYSIASIEEIIKHENGVDTYLNVATAVIASDGLSFTHPNLASGDLVLFTYAFDKESTNGNITATFYDSNVVKIDTVTGKAYRINEVVTNGVLTRTLTEV